MYNLLVALFSGAAGTYTKIKRKGGEIIGVALASSLIPPLSVVGFSLAISHYDMAGEALFLFFTNLVAIALSGTILARWYGFGFSISKKKFLLQITSYLIALVIFSVPLIIALKEIVFEVQAKHIISNQINTYLDKEEQIENYLNSIKVTFHNKKKVSIDIRAVVLTKTFDKYAEKRIKESLEKSLGKPVHLILEQIIYRE